MFYLQEVRSIKLLYDKFIKKVLEYLFAQILFTKLLQTLQLIKNIVTIENVINYLAYHDEIS